MSQIEMNENGDVVIRQDEQVEMLDMLVALKDACNGAKGSAYLAQRENESLHVALKDVDWTELECFRTERWLDDIGGLGWRCYIDGPDKGNKKLLAVLRDTLANGGWDGVEVVPAP